MILRRTCKEAAALMVAAQDRRLSVADRAALRLHLAVCGACPKFRQQLAVMRRAMAQWRNDPNGDGNQSATQP